MNIEQVRDYCIAKPSATECFPFDEDTLVFKVGNKMFALLSLEEKRLNLKCDPERALELRGQHSAVTSGWHMSKRHWNSIALEQEVPAPLLQEWMDHSYELVLSSLTKKEQARIRAAEGC